MEEVVSGLSTPEQIPSGVKRLDLDSGRLYLVPTAHVSRQSVEDVRKTIDAVAPDVVCVELCESRYKNIVDREGWKNTNIVQVIRQGKAMLLLTSLVMAAFQKRIGDRLGVKPGAEMIEAIEGARRRGAQLILADRDVQTTLKRTWARLGFWNKTKMLFQLTASLVVGEEIDEETVEKLKEEEKLGDILRVVADEFPNLKETLIDERDIYLARKIRDSAGRRTVAVLGAGHVPGVMGHMDSELDLTPLEEVPRPGRLGKVIKWTIPGVIAALFVYGFVTGGAEKSLESVYIWILVNGVLSALGAALALGHPLTIASAFFAAPLTSLNPMIAAGWVAGLVQCMVKKPTVEDLEGLPEAIGSVKGFWLNPTTRILLVVVLSNLGSVLGTFVSGSWIAARVF